MMTALNRETVLKVARPEHAPHWRQVARFSTVEKAEARVCELRSQGVEAVLSMIDGLCVLARKES